MRLIKTAAAVLNQTPMDWEANAGHILGAIAAARDQDVSILCLPELCITGYGCEDAFLSSDVCNTAKQMLAKIVSHAQGMIVNIGLPLMHRNGLLNVSCLACDGKIAGFVAKRHLAGDGIHYEPRWFKPWPEQGAARVDLDGKELPLGNLYFDCGGVRIGFEICEDAWVADRPGRALSLDGIDIILNPSASHFAFGKLDVRKRLVLEGSRAFGVTYLYANLLGNEAGRAIYDGGSLIASGGKLLAAGSRFSYRDFELTTAVVDIDATRTGQARTASFTPSMQATRHEAVHMPFQFPSISPQPPASHPPSWENSPNLKEEEFTRAVSLALFDYMRKSRSNGFVVSLSGGADSAAVSCLVASLVKFGVAELGVEGFARKLPHIPALVDSGAPDAIVHRLLTCVYQATSNSGSVTSDAAKTISAALGAEFFSLNVDAINEGYKKMIAGALGRTLDWQGDDVALQNIQARTRGPGVWMIANLKNALLLATSNRSEAAVGYATMDGDTCGGLSPIAGIDKAFIRQWLRWMETAGPMGLSPIPALSVINNQAPTAELRPAAACQTDEDDLMPYDVLDVIEKCGIRDKLSPVEVFDSARVTFPQYSANQIGIWVERFFRLWCRNQWKRERYAPSFHLDDENLDPKTWCRFPILSGGYAMELTALHEHVESLAR